MPALSFKHFSLPRRRLLVGGLGALGASGLAALCHAQGIEATEHHSVLEFDWLDAERQRPVPVRLYLPRQASASQPVPLVMFSHGIGGSRRGYSYLGRHWAGAGFASLHLQHAGSDRSVWTAGNVFSLVSRLQAAAQDSEALARVKDGRFALDQILSGELGALIDPERIIAAGHSYGANTTLLMSGAQVQRDGVIQQWRDQRIKASIVISAPPFYGEGSPARILHDVQAPSLHITATEDVIRVPGYFSAASDRIEIFNAVGSAHKMLAVFAGGSHSMFTDRAGTGGALLNPQVKAATRELTTAFIRQALMKDGEAAGELERWPQHYAAILARFVPLQPPGSTGARVHS